MKKAIVCIALALTLLAGCQQEQYNKTDGIVVGKYITDGRFGDIYSIKIIYSVAINRTNKYVMDTYEVDNKDSYESFHIKDKVIVYVNDNGIGAVNEQ